MKIVYFLDEDGRLAGDKPVSRVVVDGDDGARAFELASEVGREARLRGAVAREALRARSEVVEACARLLGIEGVMGREHR